MQHLRPGAGPGNCIASIFVQLQRYTSKRRDYIISACVSACGGPKGAEAWLGVLLHLANGRKGGGSMEHKFPNLQLLCSRCNEGKLP